MRTPVQQHHASGQFADTARICRALGEPVLVVEINDGDGRTLIVEPLRFHKIYRRGDSVVVKQSSEIIDHLFHDRPDSQKERGKNAAQS